MKHPNIRTYLLSSLLCLLLTPGFGQHKAMILVEDFLNRHPAPIDTLIKRAHKNHPEVKVFTTKANMNLQEYKIERYDWLQHISAVGSLTWGNGNVISSTSDGIDQFGLVTDQRFLNYQTGVALKIPFNTFTKQRPKLEIKKLEMDQILLEREAKMIEIAEEVAIRYYAYTTAVAKIEHATANAEATELAAMHAQTYFEAGQLKLNEYTHAIGLAASAKIAYETAKGAAIEAYFLLSKIVGESIF